MEYDGEMNIDGDDEEDVPQTKIVLVSERDLEGVYTSLFHHGTSLLTAQYNIWYGRGEIPVYPYTCHTRLQLVPVSRTGTCHSCISLALGIDLVSGCRSALCSN